MAELDEVARILGGLSAFYPRFEINEALIHAYHRVLSDIPAKTLDVTALQIGATSKWFPTASELRQTSFHLLDAANGIPNSADAWAEISRSFSTHGSYSRSPDWSHPIVGRAVEALGGYVNLCRSENPIADRAHFLKIYDTLFKRERETVRMLPQVSNAFRQIAATMRRSLVEKSAAPVELHGDFRPAADGTGNPQDRWAGRKDLA